MKIDPTSYGELAELGRHELDSWMYTQRLRGYTVDQIAKLAALPLANGGVNVSVSGATVWRRVREELNRRVKLSDGKRDQLRAIELDRLDGLMVAAMDMAGRNLEADEWGTVAPRAEKARLEAMAMVLRIGESRRKLLGLDAPLLAEVEVTTVDATDAAVMLLVEQVRDADRKAAGIV